MRTKQRTMLSGPLLPSVIGYTIPIILTGLLQLLFHAADLVVVGRFSGSISVAAIGATGALTNLLVNFFMGLSVGAGVMVAHGMGSREEEAVRRTVHTAIPTALVGGVVLTVLGVAFAEVFLRWMGTPENVLPLSARYMRIYFGGMTFTMVYNFGASILRAVGDTKTPLIFLTIAGGINVVLNLFFVIVLHMNVAGVALATVISQGFSAVAVVVALMRRKDACRFVPARMRFHKAQMLRIVQIGLPAGIQGSLFSISNVLIQSSINSFGDVVMSGNAAAGNIEGFIYVAMNSFHQTAVNFIGQNTGAQQYGRVKKILLICLGCVTVVGLTLGLAAYGFGHQLLSIYITDSPEAISYGLVRMLHLAIPYFLCGLMDVTTGALRGLGASFVPMLISVLGVCGIRIGWICTVFQIPQFHSIQGLYISYPVSWAVTFAAQMVAFWRVFRKQVKNVKTAP